MRRILAVAASAFAGLLASACETVPYSSSFAGCESRAEACFRECGYAPDEPSYRACTVRCEAEGNQCFDRAYSPYAAGGLYTGYGAVYGSPWYGRYGVWRPGYGYVYANPYASRPYRGVRPTPYRPYAGTAPRGPEYNGPPRRRYDDDRRYHRSDGRYSGGARRGPDIEGAPPRRGDGRYTRGGPDAGPRQRPTGGGAQSPGSGAPPAAAPAPSATLAAPPAVARPPARAQRNRARDTGDNRRAPGSNGRTARPDTSSRENTSPVIRMNPDER